MRGKTWRAAMTAATVLVLAATLAACTNDPLSEQYRAGDNKGFISGDFRVVELPPEERTAPIDFQASLDDGSAVTSDDYRGEILVVNFWYAACAPCRAEAPELAAAYAEYGPQGVAFLGVNLYDSAETSLAFADTYGIEYPSALTTVDSSIKLAFAEQTPLNAVPVTLVLDREGRVAARVIGQLPDSSVLTSLIEDALAAT